MPEALTTVAPVLTAAPVLPVAPEPLPADGELPEDELPVASRPPHAPVTVRKKRTDDRRIRRTLRSLRQISFGKSVRFSGQPLGEAQK